MRCPVSRSRAALLVAVASLGAVASACSTSTAVPGTHATTSAPAGHTSTSPSSATTTQSTLPPVTKLSWHPCAEKFLCASLVVPVSYSEPSDGTLKVAVVELPASQDPSKARDVVMNPGGPGGSGIQFLEHTYSQFPVSLRQQFNLVSFDPRGVGSSDPIQCESAASLRAWLGLSPAPTTTAQVTTLIAQVKAFDAACATKMPKDVLANLSTAVVADDMDRLRAAVGEAKLDYLGFSYGTYLGALYAQAFPSHVGAFVLDGALDPSLSATANSEQQAAAFEVDLHDFFAWCPTNATCNSELASGAAATYTEVMNTLATGGTLSADLIPALGGRQTVDYGLALEGVISSLYSTNDWLYLAQGLAAANAGDGSLLAALAYNLAGFQTNGTVSNLISANLAVNCLDRPSLPVSTYPSLARQFAKTAPDFGPAEAWGQLPCNYWPVPPTGRPAPLHISQSLPVLVVGSTHDPATPYAWAVALTHQIPGAVLLTRTGDGHTGYFFSACVRNWVDGFFLTGTRPPKGTVCASGT
ncbi:MAG: alpha/beta hydrolase [Acidimicrobiales bacterium]